MLHNGVLTVYIPTRATGRSTATSSEKTSAQEVKAPSNEDMGQSTGQAIQAHYMLSKGKEISSV